MIQALRYSIHINMLTIRDFKLNLLKKLFPRKSKSNHTKNLIIVSIQFFYKRFSLTLNNF